MPKVKIMSKDSPNYRWAFQVLILSISLSLMFGLLSQTILSTLGLTIAIICICVFIFISVVFDMFGIAVASADEDKFKQWRKEGVYGSSAGLKLCENSEKVCSFCADVVGDICSTLCGAGGACIAIMLTSGIKSSAVVLLVSTLVSAFIAGLTIFFKALMKEYALTNSDKLILKLGCLAEKIFIRKKNKFKNK